MSENLRLVIVTQAGRGPARYCSDAHTWSSWYVRYGARIRKQTYMRTRIGEAAVETLLTIRCDADIYPDHPMPFMTRVTGDSVLNGKMEHYATLADAKAGHERWVMSVKTEG